MEPGTVRDGQTILSSADSQRLSYLTRPIRKISLRHLAASAESDQIKPVNRLDRPDQHRQPPSQGEIQAPMNPVGTVDIPTVAGVPDSLMEPVMAALPGMGGRIIDAEIGLGLNNPAGDSPTADRRHQQLAAELASQLLRGGVDGQRALKVTWWDQDFSLVASAALGAVFLRTVDFLRTVFAAPAPADLVATV